jgi:hypothetical protein
LRNFTPPDTFVVPRDGEGNLRIVFDAETFVELIEDGFVCTEVGACATGPAPCLLGLIPPTEPQLEALFRFE